MSIRSLCFGAITMIAASTGAIIAVSAMPVSGVQTTGAELQLVARGCGPGWSPGRAGRCRPDRYFARQGRCFINRYGRRVCR
jgi:hypothetical protein